jgi:hypothetical protein
VGWGRDREWEREWKERREKWVERRESKGLGKREKESCGWGVERESWRRKRWREWKRVIARERLEIMKKR